MAQVQAMKNAKKVILEVGKKFGDETGRYYGFFESYKLEDADSAVVIIGSSAGTARATVDKLRAEGRKVGMLKVRVFRPFPFEEIAEALSGVKAVAVMDKAESFSAAGGPLFAETRSALYDLENRPKAINDVYGRAAAISVLRIVSTFSISWMRSSQPARLVRCTVTSDREGKESWHII